MSASTLTSRRVLVLVTAVLTVMVVLLAWTATQSGSEAAPTAKANNAQAGKVVFDSLPGGVKSSIAVRSFNAGGVMTGTSTGGGGGSGKFVPDDATLVLDAADVDPLLLRAVATGVHLQKVTVTIFRAGTSTRQQVWDLTDVTISEMRTSQTGSAKPPRVTVGLRYAGVTLTTYDAKGAVAGSFCYSVVAATGC